VEMGGVEPPSRAFSRGYATGLVGVLLSLPGSHRQDPGQPSRITLDLARTGAWARGTPVLRRPLRTHQGRVRADVAASNYAARASSRLPVTWLPLFTSSWATSTCNPRTYGPVESSHPQGSSSRARTKVYRIPSILPRGQPCPAAQLDARPVFASSPAHCARATRIGSSSGKSLPSVPNRHHRGLIARSISRRASRSAIASRLSYCFLPRARPRSILAKPRRMTSRSGTSVYPRFSSLPRR
jgi:hypothetical protein